MKAKTNSDKVERSVSLTATLERKGLDDEHRTVPIAISSERVIDGVKLSHADNAVDLSRADGGLVMLWDHGHDPNVGRRAIGRVHDVRVHEDGVLRGIAHFARNSFAEDVYQDVKADVLRDVSVGAQYSLEDVEMVEDQFLVKRWTPLEASIVSVPADSSVGVRRDTTPASVEEVAEVKQPIEVKRSMRTENIAPVDAGHIKAEAEQAERQRVAEITRVCGQNLNLKGVQSLQQRAISEGLTVSETNAKLNEILREALLNKHGDIFAVREQDVQPVHRQAPETENRGEDVSPTTKVEVDARDKLRDAMVESVLVRAGVATKEERAEFNKSEFRSFDLMSFCRKSCELRGLSLNGLDEMAVVTQTLKRDGGGQGTSDLTAVVENIANKQMMAGYEVDPGVWRIIAKIGSLSDFRQTTRINLGTVGNFDEIGEDGSYTRGFVSDYKESLQARTYGREMMFTRRLIVNDDVGALVDIPRKFGEKANQRVSTFVTALITSNPTLAADSTAVFDAGHSNVGTGGAISVTTLGEARKLMRLQREQESKTGADDGDFLNLRGEYLLVPPSLEAVAQQVIGSEFDPDTSNDTRTRNPFFGTFSILVEPRLEADSAAQWYVFASPTAAPTIEVAFLNGNDAPFIDQMQDWDTDGIKMKGRIDFDATWLDYRGAVRNAGS